MWCLSGVFRDVYILQRPKKVHITDYHLGTPLQLDDYGMLQSASVKATVHVSAEVWTVMCTLFGPRWPQELLNSMKQHPRVTVAAS